MNASLTIFNRRLEYGKPLVVLSCFLMMEGIFSWIFIRNSLVIEGYTKLMGIFIYGFLLFRYWLLDKAERIYVFLFSLLVLRLIGESIIKYNSFFQQLTLFTVLVPAMYVIFTKYILRTMEIDLLPFISRFYLITYVAFMLLFGRGFSFSLEATDMEDYGPFSGDTRIVHASHILMMIVPFLWYLHQFAVTRLRKYLWPVLLCTVVIIVHQHRSVWSSTLVALFFYCMAAIRNRILQPRRFIHVGVAVVAVIGICYFFASNLMPSMVDFLSDRFSEILNPAREGSTGNFRLEQREVYFKLFLERPVFGWTFEGFEMPNPLVDWWPPMTGQHFHEGYMEMLFYHGVAGLLIKYAFLLFFAVKIFSRHLSGRSIIVLAFCISGLVFSLNYVLPLIFWAMAGMGLYYLDQDRKGLQETVDI